MNLVKKGKKEKEKRIKEEITQDSQQGIRIG